MTYLRSAKHRALVDVIVTAREAAKLTQRQLSAKLKKNKDFIWKIEAHERQVNVLEFIEIARALDIAAADLITRIDLDSYKLRRN